MMELPDEIMMLPELATIYLSKKQLGQIGRLRKASPTRDVRMVEMPDLEKEGCSDTEAGDHELHSLQDQKYKEADIVPL